MTIKTFRVGYIQTNCYVITKGNQKQAVIIDPGGGYERIKAYLDDNNKKASVVLLTHGHFDHYLHAEKFQKDGAKVYIHSLDEELLTKKQGLASGFGLHIDALYPDCIIADGDTISIGDLHFKVLHTPGHSKGGCCFIINDCIFSGDTLFLESYGRVDFYGGSLISLKNSIKKLFELVGDYKVLPGHMEPTTLQHERLHNPIL